MISQESIIDKKGEGKGNVSTSLIPFMLADVDYLHQMELTMAEDRTFDTVCVNPEDLK